MWKICLIFAMLFSVCTLAGCDVREMSTLRELSRPYMGVYECTRLLVAGEEKEAELSLELAYDNTFTLSYMSGGKKVKLTGSYEADPERGEITFSAKLGTENVSRTFPMEKGAIVLDGNFLGKFLYAEFRLP